MANRSLLKGYLNDKAQDVERCAMKELLVGNCRRAHEATHKTCEAKLSVLNAGRALDGKIIIDVAQ